MSRTERVGSFVQKEISEILQRQIHDPSIVGPDVGLISVTRVEVTPDLKLAKIFLSFLSPDEAKAKAAMERFKKARGFIKAQLGRRLNIRYMPDLFFVRDTSIAEGVRIFKLLEDLAKEEARSQAAAAPAGPAEEKGRELKIEPKGKSKTPVRSKKKNK